MYEYFKLTEDEKTEMVILFKKEINVSRLFSNHRLNFIYILKLGKCYHSSLQ